MIVLDFKTGKLKKKSNSNPTFNFVLFFSNWSVAWVFIVLLEKQSMKAHYQKWNILLKAVVRVYQGCGFWQPSSEIVSRQYTFMPNN